MKLRNGIVLQAGGPTAVINASLAAIISESAGAGLARLWGAQRGWKGFMAGDWVELSLRDETVTQALATEPGAALGSGRDALDGARMPEVLERLRAHDVDVVFAIGGTGTMTAAHRLAEAAALAGQGLAVLGVPKTIDNDLVETDFCPGYGSAAKFVARATRDVGLDLRSMTGFDDVAVMEVMGRDTGWLAAAAALARYDSSSPPQLVLFPEAPVGQAQLLEAVRDWHAREGVCLVVASEGARDEDGRFLAEHAGRAEVDARGQKLFALSGGPAPYLAGLVRERLGLRCRQIRPDTIQRSSSLAVSPVDRDQAWEAGKAAVAAAFQGASGVMMALERQVSGWRTRPVRLDQVGGRQRPVPRSFISPDGLQVSEAFVEYARPLVGERLPDPIRW